MKYYPYHIKQNSILGKKMGGHPKLGKNSTNSDLSQIFNVALHQLKIVIEAKLDFRQNWGEGTPN